MKKIVSIILCVFIIVSLSITSVLAGGTVATGGTSAGSLGGSTNYEDTDNTSGVATTLAQSLNNMQDGVCSIDEDGIVTLEDDLILTETIIVPIGENVILDIYRYNIIASGNYEAIFVPDNASLTIKGRGKIIGGTNEEQGKCAIKNEGVLCIDGRTSLGIIGGGTVIEDEANGSGGSSGGAGNGTGGGSSGGASSGLRLFSAGGGATGDGGSASVNGGTPGEYETVITEIPGEIYAQNGGSGICNEGTLILNRGKIVGGFGTESNGSAISGNITRGECIVHSDDDETYELITSSATDKQYVSFRDSTAAEGLYMTFVLSNSGCCEYTYSYNEENEEYTETIKMLENVTISSYSGSAVAGGVVLDTNGYTINLVSDDEDNASGIYVYYIQLKGNGTVNGNIGFSNAVIENGTLNGELVADSLGMYKLIINGGTINGSVHTLGGTLEINGGTINGYIEALSSDIIINGGIISGGCEYWAYDTADEKNLGTIWARNGDITIDGGIVNGILSEDAQKGYPAITLDEDSTLIFNKGSLTGGVGAETIASAVDGEITKDDGFIIKESADGKYWTILEENSTEKTYLKAGTEYCISVKNGTAYKSDDLSTPVMEANAGDNITLVADSAPSEKIFKEWSITGTEIENLTNQTVTFTMPENNVVCEAVYMNENWYEIIAGETSATMNGQDYEMSTTPVSHNQKVFAAPRDLADGMGIDCTFSGETQEITFSTETKQLTYVLGSEYCISIDEQILVDAKAVMDIFLSEDFWVIGDENKVIAKKKTDENTATITLSAQNGSTTGAGDYYLGSNVTISTTTNPGYSFSGWYEGETQVSSNSTYTFVANADKTLVAKSTRSYGGGSNYGYAMTISQRVENADGTITYIKTESGKTIKETKLLDGSKKVEEISKDGTEIITVTDKNGNTEISTKYPDGTKIVEKKIKNGISVKTVTSANNETSAVITGTGNKEIEIVIPVENVDGGMVAVVDVDGTEKVIKNCLPTEEGLLLSLTEDVEVKIVDRSKDFTDTKGHWAENSIDFVVARDLFKGTSKEEFSPDAYMTRGMFAVVLHNYENNPEFKAEGQFFDVASNFWYKEAVDWLYDKGVVSGYEDGSFGAEDNITREQLITLFYRYAGNPQYSNKNIEFNDAADISEYAKDAILWAIEKGIINGKEDNNLDPMGTATRAECAAIVQRFIKTIKAPGI